MHWFGDRAVTGIVRVLKPTGAPVVSGDFFLGDLGYGIIRTWISDHPSR
jgi:hypothetical protein